MQPKHSLLARVFTVLLSAFVQLFTAGKQLFSVAYRKFSSTGSIRYTDTKIPNIYDAQPGAASFSFVPTPIKNTKFLITFNSLVMQSKLRLLLMPFMAVMFLFIASFVQAQVTVTPAGNGINISADNAANASAPAYTTIGDIVIAETAVNNGFVNPQSGVTLILTAPAGWKFNPGTGSANRATPAELTNPTIAVTASTITVTFNVNGSTQRADAITISGIQVRADDGALLSSGNIYRSTTNPGTASITGITTTSNVNGSGGTNFGTLSQTSGSLHHFSIGVISSPQTSGQAFNIGITAQDQFNNTVNSFTGTTSITSTTGTITPITSGAFSGGTRTESVTITGTGTSATISVANSGKTGTSNAFDINSPQAATSLSVSTASGAYGGTVTLSATLTSGGNGVSGKTISFSLNGGTAVTAVTNSSGVASLTNVSVTGINANTYANGVSASFAGDASYSASSGTNSLTISPKAITITPTAGQSKVYGAADPSFTFSNSESLAANAFTGALGRQPGENVADGPYAYTLGTLSAGTNYSLSLGGTNTFAITAKGLNVTAVDKSKTYDKNTFEGSGGVFTSTITGFVNGENSSVVTGTVTYTGTAITAVNANSTPYTITPVITGLSAANYSFTPVDGNLVINQRPLNISGTKVYNGTSTFGYLDLNAPENVISGDIVTLSGSATVSSKNVNTYAGFLTNSLISSNSNYKVTSGIVNVSITPKELTVTAVDKNKVYDKKTFTGGGGVFAYVLDGFITGESSSVVSGLVTYTGNATTAINASTTPYTITPVVTGLSATNYSFTPVDGNLTIDRRPLNFTGSRMYNGRPSFLPADLVLSNIISGDAVAVSDSASVSSSDVGTYTGFVANVLTTSNENYTAQGGTVNVTITPQTANPVADAFYTGPSFYWTPNSSSNTATVSLIATLRNNMNYTGNIRTARVSFFIRNGDNSTTPITGAQNLPVGLVDPNDETVGTAAVNVQMSIGNSAAGIFNIAVKVTGNYTSNLTDPTKDGSFTIAKPTPGGIITGAGWLKNKTSETLASSGYIKGAEQKKTHFDFFVTYNKSLKNPQGGVQITVKSYNDRNGNPTSTIHTYLLKSNAITVLAVNPPKTQGESYTAQFSGKANVTEVFEDGHTESIEGNCTMQLDMTDFDPVNGIGDQLAVTIYRSKGGVWFSSAWDGTKTQQTVVVNEAAFSSQLSVTGNGGTSNATLTRTMVTQQPIIEAVMFNLHAYPNPSTSQFTVQIESNDRYEKVQLRVMDLNGRIVEVFNSLQANQTIKLGGRYRPGMYIVEMIQGTNRKQLKLIKQAD